MYMNCTFVTHKLTVITIPTTFNEKHFQIQNKMGFLTFQT